MITAGEKSVGESAPFRVICMCVWMINPEFQEKQMGMMAKKIKKEAKITHKEFFFPPCL